ncbi:MAG: helix-turn-helix transcriptional regulator [Clostridia bacterium]|nr:helix-turn-helix transcriptional regulator [Clostridia bacterium]
MRFSYNKLWKILIDKRMTKKTLMERTGVSKATFAKMNKGDSVTLDVLARLCKELNVDIGDVVEIEKELF